MATPSNVPLAGGGNSTAPRPLFLCDKCYHDVGLAVFGRRNIRFTQRPETLCFCCENGRQVGLFVHESYFDEVKKARYMFLQLEEQRRELEKTTLEYGSKADQ